LLGRDMQRYLQEYNIIPEIRFSKQDMSDDEWELLPACLVTGQKENKIDYREVLSSDDQEH
jgi:hypothetical protein